MVDGVSGDALHLFRLIYDTPLMRELSVAEQRYQAVMAVIGDGLSVSQDTQKAGELTTPYELFDAARRA
jgi:hypothetical protein